MRENWKDLFLKGLETESDIFRLGDIFKENVARQAAPNSQRTSRVLNPTTEVASARRANDAEPTQLSEVVVTAQRPDWLQRQMNRARYGLEDFVNGRPSTGEAYYGLPDVQPRTPQQKAQHAEFVRQRDAFQARTRSNDHLQRNIDAARRNPGKYAGDVALGTLKGVGQEGLNLANGGLAGYALQHPEAAAGAVGLNSLTGRRIFDISQNPWGLPTVQISQPEGLRPRGDIQNQWSYVGRFGGLVGTGAAAEALLPAKVVAPTCRLPRPSGTPNGQYYDDLNRQPFIRGGENDAARIGRMAHDDLRVRVEQKPGWSYETRYPTPGGSYVKPDVTTPRNRILEMKPNTPSGRRAADAAVKRYQELTRRRVRGIFYDPTKFK